MGIVRGQYWLLNESGEREREWVPTEWERWRGTDVALVEHKNNGAISRQPMPIFKWASNYSSGCQFTARHTGAKLNLFWCYTSLCTQPMSNFAAAAPWLRPWDNDAQAFSSHSPVFRRSLSSSPSFHLGPSQWRAFIKGSRVGAAQGGRGATNYW